MANAFLMRKNGRKEAAILKKTNRVRAKHRQKQIKLLLLRSWFKHDDVAKKEFLDCPEILDVDVMKKIGEKSNVENLKKRKNETQYEYYMRFRKIYKSTEHIDTPQEYLQRFMKDNLIKLSYLDVQKVRKHVKGKKLSDTQLAKEILQHTGTKVSKGCARKNRSKFGAKPLFVRK